METLLKVKSFVGKYPDKEAAKAAIEEIEALLSDCRGIAGLKSAAEALTTLEGK